MNPMFKLRKNVPTLSNKWEKKWLIDDICSLIFGILFIFDGIIGLLSLNQVISDLASGFMFWRVDLEPTINHTEETI